MVSLRGPRGGHVALRRDRRCRAGKRGPGRGNTQTALTASISRTGRRRRRAESFSPVI